MSYDEFKDESIKYYKELPYETQDLYKKYVLLIPFPQESKINGAWQVKGESRKLISMISDKIKIKFDVIVSNSTITNESKCAKISEMKSLSNDMLNSKIYKSDQNKFGAFVNAYAKHAVNINAKKETKEKVNMLFVNDSDLPIQVMAKVEDGASLNLFEFYASTAKEESLVAPLHEIVLGKDSRAEITILHNENDKTNLLNLSKGTCGDGSKLKVNLIHNGSMLTKSVNIFGADGADSSVDVNEIVYGTMKQRFDLNTFITNAKEKSQTRLESGVVLDGSAQCVLKGFAKVAKWTKGARSRINERGILLSMDSHIDALPDMSIDYSDQVSATHSAATAPIDKEALFYLTSRGLEEIEARKLFVASFLFKYLSDIEDPSVKEVAASIMLNRIENEEFGIISDITPKGIWLTSRMAK